MGELVTLDISVSESVDRLEALATDPKVHARDRQALVKVIEVLRETVAWLRKNRKTLDRLGAKFPF